MLQEVKHIFKDASDLLTETLDNSFWQMEMAYFPAMCDEQQLKDGLLIPFSYRFDPDEFRRMLHANPKYQEASKKEQWANLLLKGFILLQIEDQCYSFKASRQLFTQPDTTQVETSLQGPQSAFTEDLDLNIYLLRFRYNVSTLVLEPLEKGTHSKTAIMVIYDKQLVNDKVLQMLQDQMKKVNIDLLQSSGQLVKDLTAHKSRIFPTILQTERPDRVANMLRKGKVIILINGSRFALILPVRLYDFMHAMDDEYEGLWISRLIVFMRYIAVMLTALLPALYIAIVSYNPEIFRVQIAFTIDASRTGVPYPSFVEVFIMLFMIEALIEASIRLPKYVGSTATTVGGLILGQAAQTAGLVSSIMIIITSVVAISNFVIPNPSFSQAIRLVKYAFILIAIIYGISGIAVMFFSMIVYICNLRSFGEPYFSLFMPKSIKAREG